MPTLAEYRIYIRRNSTLERLGEIQDWIAAEFHLRFNDVGAWILRIPFNSVTATFQLLHKQFGIVVYRNGTFLFSGPMTNIRKVWRYDESYIEVAGRDDNFALQARLAFPVPSGPPYTAAMHDVRTGIASTIMRQYVDVNAGPSAIGPRKWAKLIIGADPLIGTSVRGSVRFDVLIEKLRELAIAGGNLGFRVVQNATPMLEFQVYAPVDRTLTAVFSPLTGTLSEFESVFDAGDGNYVIVGGGGEGTARLFYERGDSEAIAGYDRIEFFRDRRDTTDISEMAQTAKEELAGNADKFTLNITAFDTEAVAFQTAYNVGDRVTVAVITESTTRRITVEYTYQDIVREIQIDIDRDHGEKITPMVGTAETRSLGFLHRQRTLDKRISQVERRQ